MSLSTMRGQSVKLGMLNVRGLRYTAAEIQDWIEEENLNVTAISETFLRPGTSTGVSLRHEHVTGRNGRGGAAIIVYGMAKHKVVLRYTGAMVQAIGIRIKNVTYVSIYVAPRAPAE